MKNNKKPSKRWTPNEVQIDLFCISDKVFNEKLYELSEILYKFFCQQNLDSPTCEVNHE